MAEPIRSKTAESSLPASEPAKSAGPSQQRPWITYIVIVLCGVLWAYLSLGKDWPYYPGVVKAVAPAGFRIWTGAIWGLVTAPFVHFGFWHLLFNMWWAKEFGSILEPSMGRRKYLLFILSAAMVSAGLQLLFTDQTGIGFSGVVYAMFGFGVVARRVHPQYQEFIDKRTVQWLLGWLGACIVLTFFDIMNIANEAHIAGLVFGFCVGMVFVVRSFVVLSSLVLVLLTAMTILSVTYLPWSEQWRLRYNILEIIESGERAKTGDPEAQCLYGHFLMRYKERKAEGISWLTKSVEQGYVPAMNGLAWVLATDPDPAVRNGGMAVELAFQACTENGWQDPAYMDTLAAAYAEVEQWDKAVATQQQALAKLVDGDGATRASLQEHLRKYQQRKKVRE